MHTVQGFLFDAVFETIDNYIFIFFSYEQVNPFYNSQTYKICLSFSLNFYLRLMETKYNEGMNYAIWRLAFCLASTSTLYTNARLHTCARLGEIADKGKPMERLAKKVKQMFMLNKKEYIYLSLPNSPNNDLV